MKNKAFYTDLSSAWHAIAKTLDITQDNFADWKWVWHDRVFCDFLKLCGWTLTEWNDECKVRTRRHNIKKEADAAKIKELDKIAELFEFDFDYDDEGEQ